MSRVKQIIGGSLIAALAAVSLTACNKNHDNNAAKTETKVQQNSYQREVAQEPAHEMNYSPTRKTINFWIDTWGKPGKIAYVYLQNDTGNLTGFFTLDGPPVSMCSSLTPNYRLVDPGGSSDNGNIVVPAPGVDGVYYSGGECNTYYGKDSTTGAYVQFTVGNGQNILLYDQPLTNHPNVTNLAPGKYTGK